MNAAECIARLREEIQEQKNRIQHLEDQIYSAAALAKADRERIKDRDRALVYALHALYINRLANKMDMPFKHFYEYGDPTFHVRAIFPYEYFKRMCKEYHLQYVEII